MKSLLLLRHAEAVAISGTMKDLERPLSARGLAQAQALGAWLREHAWVAERILCSSAVRAQQSAETVRVAAGWKTRISVREELYNAEAGAMIDLLRNDAADVDSLLLVAHAPGIAALASALTTHRADLLLVCEAATLIEVVSDIASWADIAQGCARLRLVLPS